MYCSVCAAVHLTRVCVWMRLIDLCFLDLQRAAKAATVDRKLQLYLSTRASRWVRHPGFQLIAALHNNNALHGRMLPTKLYELMGLPAMRTGTPHLSCGCAGGFGAGGRLLRNAVAHPQKRGGAAPLGRGTLGRPGGRPELQPGH